MSQLVDAAAQCRGETADLLVDVSANVVAVHDKRSPWPGGAIVEKSAVVMMCGAPDDEPN